MVWSPPPLASPWKVVNMPVTVPSKPSSGAEVTQTFMICRRRAKGVMPSLANRLKKVCMSWSERHSMACVISVPIGPRHCAGSFCQRRHARSGDERAPSISNWNRALNPKTYMMSPVAARGIMAHPPPIHTGRA
ncbi:MAG: hypothetical protein BWX70_00690 [Verrucomicrobia bacterium ADurb.Bin070]|nr:MAG: hypothetical protein BWX70_00690 [Verrucomicrobia bacterium ADurb.Bin070]